MAMSLPIDYWDYLGWKDTLAKPGHTARQRAYAQMRGDRAVYTPQVVVNGVVHVQGSDKAAIERAIAQTRQQAGTLSVPVHALGRRRTRQRHGCGQLGCDARAARSGCARSPGAFRSRSAAARIADATITYYNVVRRWVKLGEWNGSARTSRVPLSDVDGATTSIRSRCFSRRGDGSKPGRMLGAARRVDPLTTDRRHGREAASELLLSLDVVCRLIDRRARPRVGRQSSVHVHKKGPA